eukprot:6194447-Pleurochrysis_carterae.AAC.1
MRRAAVISGIIVAADAASRSDIGIYIVARRQRERARERRRERGESQLEGTRLEERGKGARCKSVAV